MGDIDDAEPSLFQARDQTEENRDIGTRKTARGLVEYQQLRVEDDRPRDLDDLLLGHGQGRYRRIGSDIRMRQLRQGGLGTGPHRALQKESRPGKLDPKEQVLGDGKMRSESELLVHHDHAAIPRVSRTPWGERSPIDEEGARISDRDAGQDVDERALAGPVLANERPDFSGVHREVDTIHGDSRAETLSDVARLESRCRQASILFGGRRRYRKRARVLTEAIAPDRGEGALEFSVRSCSLG